MGTLYNPSEGLQTPFIITSWLLTLMCILFVFAAIRVSLFKTMVHWLSQIWPREMSEALFKLFKTVAVFAFVDSAGERLMVPCCDGDNVSPSGRITAQPLCARTFCRAFMFCFRQ